ncbi:MAG: amidohydrolase family protein [bacterium]
MNGSVIDVHIHFGAPKDEESGCYWSDEFMETAAYLAMLLITKSLFKKVNIERVRKHLLGAINGSEYVDQSVVLAMDEVFDEHGIPHPEWTHLYVPNRYLVRLAKENERVLVGASVHPYRSDWREQLDYCLENRAVLCKWIPSSQLIDPTHSKCIAFYQKLADHRLPLLCHAGPEHVIPTSDKSYIEYNNPKYLRKALDRGVTVIVAHCAVPYFWIFDAEYQDDFEEFLKLFDEAERRGWNLYADVSAFASPLRSPYIDRIKERVPAERLLFASDYPVPISEICYNKSTNFFSWLCFILKVAFMKNPLDKNYHLIKEMAFGDSIFTNASRLFRDIEY